MKYLWIWEMGLGCFSRQYPDACEVELVESCPSNHQNSRMEQTVSMRCKPKWKTEENRGLKKCFQHPVPTGELKARLWLGTYRNLKAMCWLDRLTPQSHQRKCEVFRTLDFLFWLKLRAPGHHIWTCNVPQRRSSFISMLLALLTWSWHQQMCYVSHILQRVQHALFFTSVPCHIIKRHPHDNLQ